MNEKLMRVGRLAAGLLLTFLVLVLQPAIARADGTQTRLEIQLSAWEDGRVEVAGTLRDIAGTGVVAAPVAASVHGGQVGSSATAGDGGFNITFTMPEQYRSGTTQVDVSYDGDGRHAGSRAAQAIDYGGGAQQLAANSIAEKAGERHAVVLTLNPATTTASPGSTVNLSGTLATSEGNAIANAAITFTLGGAAQPDSTVLTGNDGTFSSFVELPGEAAAGPISVAASFAGSSQLQAAGIEVAVTVEAPTPSSEPAATEDATAPSTSVETLGSAAPGSAAPQASDAAVNASPGPAAVAPEGDSAILTWGIIGGIVLASGTGLALIVLALRPRRRTEDPNEVGLIGEPEDPEAELLGEDDEELWEEPIAHRQPARGMPEEVLGLDESASAFAPPVTVRAMPGDLYRRDPDPIPARGIVEDTQPQGDRTESAEESRGPAVPRRAAP